MLLTIVVCFLAGMVGQWIWDLPCRLEERRWLAELMRQAALDDAARVDWAAD